MHTSPSSKQNKRIAVFVFAMFACPMFASSAWAQTWSLDGFRSLRNESNTTLEAWKNAGRGSPERSRLGVAALNGRHELIEYIESWQGSGTMNPEYLSSVGEARVVYYADVIGIYAAEGLCEDAATTLSRLDNIYLAEAPSERGTDAYHAAVAVSTACEPVEVVIAELQPANEARVDEVTTPDPQEATLPTELTPEESNPAPDAPASGEPNGETGQEADAGHETDAELETKHRAGGRQRAGPREPCACRVVLSRDRFGHRCCSLGLHGQRRSPGL